MTYETFNEIELFIIPQQNKNKLDLMKWDRTERRKGEHGERLESSKRERKV